jgi:hypothetical protein
VGAVFSTYAVVGQMGGKNRIQELFFVSFTIAGRTYLIGSALHIIGFFLGPTPFRGYLTDTFNNLFALTGWTRGVFFFSHVFLLLHDSLI